MVTKGSRLMNKPTVFALVAAGLLAVACSGSNQGPPASHDGDKSEKTPATSLPGVTDDGVLKDEAQQRAWNPEFKETGVAFNATEATRKAIGVFRWELEIGNNIQGWIGFSEKGDVLGAIKIETKFGEDQKPVAVETSFADISKTPKDISTATIDFAAGVTKGQLSAAGQSWLSASANDSKAFEDTTQRPYGLVGCVLSVEATGWSAIGAAVVNLFTGAACGVANVDCSTRIGKTYDVVDGWMGTTKSQCSGASASSILNSPLLFG